MAKIRKAQDGQRTSPGTKPPMDARSMSVKRRLDAAKNPLLKYSGSSKRSVFSKKTYPTSISVDTTGYASGKTYGFPASNELRLDRAGKKNPTMYGIMRREGVEKALKSQKKTGGNVAKAQRGNRVCGPGGCRQNRGMVGYGGGGRRSGGPGLLKRIFAPNRKTGGTTKKK